MSRATTSTARRRALGLLVALAALPALAGCSLGGGSTKHLSAHFSKAIGVYVSSDVRILGVAIGKVTAIHPDGDTVRVDMEYDSKYKIPAAAKAVVIAPSIVSDRYVQLTPAYTGGPVLADHSTIDVDRTQVPLELDQIYADIDKIDQALGPNGANKNGALSDLLKVSAKNLEGNGALLGTTLSDFSRAVQTLSENRDDLFGTVDNLQKFTTQIANSDSTVRQFNQLLATVSDQLAGERGDLATAVKQLSVALGDVATFVKDNREALASNVSGLADVTKVLVNEQTALKEFLDTAPTALSNLQLAYNPTSGTLDTRDDGTSQLSPAILCGVLNQAQGGTAALVSMLPTLLPGVLPDTLKTVGDQLTAQCKALAAGAGSGGGGLPSLPGGLPSLPGGLPVQVPTLPIPGAGTAGAAVAPPSDSSLGALLMGTK